jgi:colanic acid/amylovoran biosynthesis glycosyltransferase
VALAGNPKRYLESLGVFLRAAVGLPPAEALQLLYHFFAGVGFSRQLRRMDVSHVHCHFTSATNMALAASLVADTPFSFTAHASNDLFVRPVLLEEKLARATFVVTVCDYSLRFLDGISGYRFSDKLQRIYNGVEHLELKKVQPSATVPASGPVLHADDSCRIVSVGSLVAAKGHASLVQACARLRDDGYTFECRIIGEGPERPTLERLIAGFGLTRCVTLLGALPLDAVYAELQHADVFALLTEIGPSGYRDGFPTAILEAMAAELPVIATSLSGIPEMVENGVTGILVQERDVHGAAEAMKCLLQSRETRRAMGLAGRVRVRNLFDLDHSADQLLGLLSREAELEAAAALAGN